MLLKTFAFTALLDNTVYSLVIQMTKLIRISIIVFQYQSCFLKALQNLRAIFMLPLMFYMFSLSAQTPREDSGVGELITRQSDIIPLKIGHKVPEEFWTKEHLFYINGDTVRRNLQEYKGKLLILDFWMIGCSKCFLHQKEINYYKKLYGGELAVIMVNGVKTRNNYASIHSYLKNEWFQSLGLGSFSSIIESTYLDQLLQPAGYPMYYWINQYGILQTITYRNLLDRDYLAPFLDK
ncbi:Thioredoxin domain-containing protein [Sphingobacterium prati]